MSQDPAHGKGGAGASAPSGASAALGPEAHVMVGNADLFVNWARKSSLWYLLFATACCGIELMQAGASRYDLDRFGAVFRATDSTNAYLSWGKGFETPTMNELSYQPGGGAGLNFSLQAATSKHLELGLKALLGNDTRVNAALCQLIGSGLFGQWHERQGHDDFIKLF